MMDEEGYKHIHTHTHTHNIYIYIYIYNISTAKMVAQMHLSACIA
jgi:hypothetical protein